MYKLADFLNAFHRSNGIIFDFSILFVAYGPDAPVNNKYLLYTDLKGTLETQWKQFLTLLDNIVRNGPKVASSDKSDTLQSL